MPVFHSPLLLSSPCNHILRSWDLISRLAFVVARCNNRGGNDAGTSGSWLEQKQGGWKEGVTENYQIQGTARANIFCFIIVNSVKEGRSIEWSDEDSCVTIWREWADEWEGTKDSIRFVLVSGAIVIFVSRLAGISNWRRAYYRALVIEYICIQINLTTYLEQVIVRRSFTITMDDSSNRWCYLPGASQSVWQWM